MNVFKILAVLAAALALVTALALGALAAAGMGDDERAAQLRQVALRASDSRELQVEFERLNALMAAPEADEEAWARAADQWAATRARCEEYLAAHADAEVGAALGGQIQAGMDKLTVLLAVHGHGDAPVGEAAGGICEELSALLGGAAEMDLALLDQITFEGDQSGVILRVLLFWLVGLLALLLAACVVFILLIRPKRRPPTDYPAPWPPATPHQ